MEDSAGTRGPTRFTGVVADDAGLPGARTGRSAADGGTSASIGGSVRRANRILAELAAASPLTLSEVARRTGLAKTTAHRLIRTLLADGLIHRCGSRYHLGYGVSWLAAPAYEPMHRLRRARRRLLPHMIDLYESTRQTVNLAVLHGDEVVYVDRVYGHARVRTPSDDVDVAPADRTAAGKLLLAFQSSPAAAGTQWTIESELDDIRRAGVAYSFGAFTEHVHCAAAPVRDRAGRVIAAVAVAGEARRFDPVHITGCLRRTAHAMSLVVPGPTIMRGAARRATP